MIELVSVIFFMFLMSKMSSPIYLIHFPLAHSSTPQCDLRDQIYQEKKTNRGKLTIEGRTGQTRKKSEGDEVGTAERLVDWGRKRFAAIRVRWSRV